MTLSLFRSAAPLMPVPEAMPPYAERERIGLALRSARKAAKLSTARAAELGSISVSTLGSIERGDHSLTSVGAGKLRQLPAAFGLSWEAFYDLISPVYGPYIPLSAPDSKSSDTAPSQALESVGFVMKDVFDLLVASRPLSEAEPIPDLSPIPVPRSQARPGLVLFRVRGDSMTVGAEGIHEGDIIYVDTHDRTPHPDRVYVIHIPGDGVTLKRVRSLGGALWLFSDNPDQTRHAPFQADSASVIGRVYDLSRRPRVRL